MRVIVNVNADKDSEDGILPDETASGDPNMKCANRERATEKDLEQVIEPLASYLCAADQPRAALKLALAVLLKEMRQTNMAATAQVAAFARATAN